MRICYNRDFLKPKLLKKKVTKSSHNVLYHEQTFTNFDNSILKPDLVFITEGDCQVIDVTIRYEDEDSFRNAYIDKQVKYDGLTSKHPVIKTCQVVTLIIGSTGAVPVVTRESLTQLGFSKLEIRGTSLQVLRSSLSIMNTFLDYRDTINTNLIVYTFVLLFK